MTDIISDEEMQLFIELTARKNEFFNNRKDEIFSILKTLIEGHPYIEIYNPNETINPRRPVITLRVTLLNIFTKDRVMYDKYLQDSPTDIEIAKTGDSNRFQKKYAEPIIALKKEVIYIGVLSKLTEHIYDEILKNDLQRLTEGISENHSNVNKKHLSSFFLNTVTMISVAPESSVCNISLLF